MARRLVVVPVLALFALFVASAQADTGNIIEPQNETAKAGFQSGTCTKDTPTCTNETPSQFFTQAGGHPPIGFTQYIVKHEETTGKVEPAGVTIPTSPITEPEADRTIKTLRTDLPPGLTINPNATPKCSLAEFENKIGEFQVPACGKGSIVGHEEVTLVTNVGRSRPGSRRNIRARADAAQGSRGAAERKKSVPMSPSTTSIRKKAKRRCSASSSPPKRSSSSKPKCLGRTTSMRPSRSTCRRQNRRSRR